MIITGYIGQFYEVTSISKFFIWGAISTVFFIHILILMHRVIKEGKEGIPEKAKKALSTIWILFVIAWMLYPGAYLMPHLLGIEGGFFNENGVVGRQITYTIADVSSKVIYGVLLTVAAQSMSKAEGYDYNSVEK
jgi:bacteriorhodopsin